jgi:hypothetical protein
LLPASITFCPGMNMRLVGFGVACVWMNMPRRWAAGLGGSVGRTGGGETREKDKQLPAAQAAAPPTDLLTPHHDAMAVARHPAHAKQLGCVAVRRAPPLLLPPTAAMC